MNLQRQFASLLCGLIFGLGLAISGMIYPQKVLGFLDVTGAWDPTLLFVLGGATGLSLVTFHLIQRRRSPLLADHFSLPEKTRIDFALVAGAILFGIGWGISGYCPGPAIARLAAPGHEAFVFIPAMLAGSLLQQWQARRRPA